MYSDVSTVWLVVSELFSSICEVNLTDCCREYFMFFPGNETYIVLHNDRSI